MDRNTIVRQLFFYPACLFAIGLLGGCAGVMVQEDLPTIAHVHVGHAITGWEEAPDQKGLFIAAEDKAEIALNEVKQAMAEGTSSAQKKKQVAKMLTAINGQEDPPKPSAAYGLIKSLDEAVSHITFAAESDDATENVQGFASQFATDAQVVIERAQLISAVGNEIAAIDSSLEINALLEELVVLNELNFRGDPATNSIGMLQLRESIDAMLAREDPPYQPVSTRYLFGLIRLPGGQWDYKWNQPGYRHRYRPEGSGY